MKRILIKDGSNVEALKNEYVTEIKGKNNRYKKTKISKLKKFAEQLKMFSPVPQAHIDYLLEMADEKCFDEILDIIPEELDAFLNRHPKLILDEDDLNKEFIFEKKSVSGIVPNESDGHDSENEAVLGENVADSDDDNPDPGNDADSDDNDDSDPENDTDSDKGKKKVIFWKRIVGIMGYSHVRDSVIVPYMSKQNIRACVYCNAEPLAYVKGKKQIKVKGKKGKPDRIKIVDMGRYQIDHFKPQSLYPYLCISFYNFQPCCNFCNLWKSNEPTIEFNLYTKNENKINPFKINLDEKSVINYVFSHENEDLKIVVDTPNDSNLINNHDKIFEVNKLYQFYVDEAEEIVWKALCFSGSYIDQLKQAYEKLVKKNVDDFGRMLYGFYENEQNIHIRALTKMKQDVFLQIKDLAPEIFKALNV